MTTRSIGLCPVHHHPLVGLHERRRIITPLLNLLFRVRNRLLALLYIKPSPPFLIILPLTLVPQNALALHTWLKRSSQGRSLCPCPSSRHSIPEPEADHHFTTAQWTLTLTSRPGYCKSPISNTDHSRSCLFCPGHSCGSSGTRTEPFGSRNCGPQKSSVATL